MPQSAGAAHRGRVCLGPAGRAGGGRSVRRDGHARGVGGRADSFGLADSVAMMTARMNSRVVRAWVVLVRRGLQVDGRLDGQRSGRPDGGRVGAFPSTGPMRHMPEVIQPFVTRRGRR